MGVMVVVIVVVIMGKVEMAVRKVVCKDKGLVRENEFSRVA